MSLKSNFTYIRDWINLHFLKKEDVDLNQYSTHEEVLNHHEEVLNQLKSYANKSELDNYLTINDYKSDEEIVAEALVDLDSRIGKGVIGEKEEKVIAIALHDLNNRINASAPTESPIFTGTPTAPTAASNANSNQIATVGFVSNAISEGVPVLGVSLNGTAGTLSNHIANLSLTKSSTGAGNIVTDVSIDGNVITVNKSNLPFKANSGTTRPTLSSGDVGYTFLDLSLGTSGKPIWWNGSNWIDATGATV